jgi:hypothetical protein
MVNKTDRIVTSFDAASYRDAAARTSPVMLTELSCN